MRNLFFVLLALSLLGTGCTPTRERSEYNCHGENACNLMALILGASPKRPSLHELLGSISNARSAEHRAEGVRRKRGHTDRWGHTKLDVDAYIRKETRYR